MILFALEDAKIVLVTDDNEDAVCLIFTRSFRSNLWMKNAPEKCFMVLFCLLPFIRNLFLVHHQLAIVMVARIRLLWILEVLIQLRKRRHHRRHFCPYWTDIISSDWYYFLPLQNPGLKSISTSETLFRRNMRMVRVIRRFTKASVRIHVAQLKWPEVIHWRSLRNPYVVKYLWWPWQWRIDVKEKRIFSPDKIFTASKASRRNLHIEMASRWQIFLQTKQTFA